MANNPAVISGTDGVYEKSVVFGRKTATDEICLAGTLALPQEITSAPELGVITIHGWGGTRCGPHRIMVRIGRRLAAQNIPTLRFDLSGRGISDGKAKETNLDDMIADTIRAREFLITETGCKNVAYCGICSGGNVAIGAHTLAPVSRLALISTLPFSARSGTMARRKIISRFSEYARKAASLNTWKRLFRGEINFRGVGNTIAASGIESGAARKLKDSKRDIMKAFASVPAPCRFIYGGGDPEWQDAWKYYDEFCKAQSITPDMKLVDGANHNFYTTDWSREVEDSVIEFLVKD
ncbi:MAG: alpha/beta fold hydrolase [Planctomycetes bacterium]|nr:alpha/beta fold hydrolase [Planctomycetota bacterium]